MILNCKNKPQELNFQPVVLFSFTNLIMNRLIAKLTSMTPRIIQNAKFALFEKPILDILEVFKTQ